MSLRKKPETLAEAIASAAEVEYALSFDGGRKTEPSEVSLVQRPTPNQGPPPYADHLSKLQSSLDETTKRIEALESVLAAREQTRGTDKRRDRDRRICFLCGQGYISNNNKSI